MLTRRLTSTLCLSALAFNRSKRPLSTISQTKPSFTYGVCEIPHPEKQHKGGEDASYASTQVLAVADGVGGWIEMGIDPAKYSKALCKNIEKLWKNSESKYLSTPKQLIIDAAGITKEIGTSTCCILTIDEKAVLHGAYIGDSGYAILRENKEKKELELVFESEEQTKSFNFPFQIGTNGDPPQRSLEFKHLAKNKEIVVVGTDGLWDNMDIEQIRNFIYPLIQQETEMKVVAEQLAKQAFVLSLDGKYNSPFAKRARKHYYRFSGGKSDDITVIVAEINTKN